MSSESIQAEFLTVGYSGSKDQPQPVSVDPTPAPQPLVNANGQPIRLLFAVDSQFPRLGGAENQALKLASALREQGAEIEFITPRVIKSEPMSTTHLGFKVQRIDYPHIRFLGSLVLMFKVYRYFIRNADRFDAAHVHVTHLMAASAGYARAKSGLPVITKISGFYEFEGGVLDPRAKFKPLNFLIRRGLRLVDFVQTISSQTQEKLLQAGFTQAQIQFVPNGIDTRLLPVPAPGTQPIRIGYCGRLRDVKGVHVLLDAFAALQKILPDVQLQLAIAGSGDTQDALNEQAANLGIQHCIQWLGTIDDTDEFYRSLDIYVQPSFAEGLPNSVMEAMLAERPVVASAIGGNTDLIEDGNSGLLFEAGDSSVLAERLASVISDSEMAEKLGKAGRRWILEHYGFESVCKKLAKLYRG